jgi:hypothetical protein
LRFVNAHARLISPLDEIPPCPLSRSIADAAEDAEGSDSTEDDAWRVEAAASGTCTGDAVAAVVVVVVAASADPAAAADGSSIEGPLDGVEEGVEAGAEGAAGSGTGTGTAALGTWAPATRTLDCTGQRAVPPPAGTGGAKSATAAGAARAARGWCRSIASAPLARWRLRSVSATATEGCVRMGVLWGTHRTRDKPYSVTYILAVLLELALDGGVPVILHIVVAPARQLLGDVGPLVPVRLVHGNEYCLFVVWHSTQRTG